MKNWIESLQADGPFDTGNRFARFFDHEPHRIMQKWENYFEIYDRHLGRFLDRPVTFLEIGISQGGSLDMWRSCLAPGSLIVGIDVNPRCRRFEDDNTRVFIGDQADPEFWEDVLSQVPRVDVVLDDGGHTMEQQIASFNSLFPRIAEDGLYMCEDTHTSYSPDYGGGYRAPGSVIEFSKGFVDALHAWHAPEVPVDSVTRSAHSVHFYDGIVVLEKRPMQKPRPVQKANPSSDAG